MSLFGRNKKDKKGTGGTHSFFKRKDKQKTAEPDAIYVKRDAARSREVKGYMRAIPIILVALALFTTVCLVTGSEVGTFGSFFADFLKGLFSYMAYCIPALMVIHAIFYISDVKAGRVLGRAVLSVILLLTLSELAYLIPNFNSELTFDAAKFYEDGVANIGGGFFGGVIGYALISVIGKIGVIIFTSLVFVLYAVYCFSGKNSALKRVLLSAFKKIVDYFARLEEQNNQKRERAKQKREEKIAKAAAKAEAKQGAIGRRAAQELMNDDFFSARNGVSTLEIPQLGIYEAKENALGETVDSLRSSVDKVEPENIPTEDPTERHYGDFDENGGEFVRDGSVGVDGTIFFDIREGEQSRASDSLDCADSFFTEEFDPYELALNEKYAYKPSSKKSTATQTGSFTENMGELTPRQLAREKMAREFEERKREEEKRRAEEKTREEAARIAEELRKKKEEEERLEAERLAKEREREERARQDEERRRREDAEIMSDYSRFGQSNSAFSATFKANNPFRFVDSAAEDNQSAQQTAYTERPAYQPPQPPMYNAGESTTSGTYGTPNTAQDAYIKTVPVRNEGPSSYSSEKAYKASAPTVLGATHDSVPAYTVEPSPITRILSAPVVGTSDSVGHTQASYEASAAPAERISVTPPAYTPTPEVSADTASTAETEDSITLTRTRVETSFAPDEAATCKVGLDFSDDDEDDEDEVGFEPEPVIVPTEIPEDERNPDLDAYKSRFDMFNKDNVGGGNTPADEGIETAEADDDNEGDDLDLVQADEDSKPPFVPTSCDNAPKSPKPEIKKPERKKPDYSKYKFPPIDLLAPPPQEDTQAINDEIYQCSEKLLGTLDSFGITATVRGVDRGPRITRYSIVPAKGISVNQISKREDDIACALAAESIRIEAPIPGKSAVGIEVPNKKSSIVSLRELIESPYFTSRESKTAVCIGKSVEGETIFGDISDMPHLLIAGATGMGKSVCMNALITSILYRSKPDEVKFIMIDPKMVEFAPYNGIPHLLVPVVTDPKQAAGALDWAVQEMNKRYVTIQKLSVRTIDSYNEKVKENPELGEHMPKIIVFIDELNDLMINMRDPVENLITSIAQKARAAGIHLVIGTQRPSVNVITGVIKANIPSRIACKVASGVDSRTILEQIGAERLIGKGDMLFVDGKSTNPKRVQGAFVSEKETERVVEFIKKAAGEAAYDEQAIEDIRRAAQKCDKSGDGDDDDFTPGGGGTACLRDKKFLAAVEMSIRNGSVATSWLQRRMSVGYSKAAQYIDNMEELGVVNEKNGSKPREVLISLDEWYEKLARLTSID
ncbi:MAG: DNA translocase FtsK 4TM domain-containing protein [Clostridia bacterium]|nr:DNA translocase FtsK 4TM domain-containing protein [Clostridia bacterium]